VFGCRAHGLLGRVLCLLASQYCAVNECICQGSGLSRCGEACLNLAEDEQNCGACGKTCRTGESCRQGKCECGPGEQYCDNAEKCVPLASDEANCGACGQACNPTEQCSAGKCQCPQAEQAYCASEGKCVDTLANTKHCGGCDSSCKATQICSDGSCGCSGPTQEHCPKANACVDLWTDSKHCGACDKACPAKTHCANSGCLCDAVAQTLCGTSCFDLQTNAKNCGACGNACPASYLCAAGTCQCPDPTVGVAIRLTNNALQDERAFAAWNGARIGVAYLRQIATGGAAYNLRFALLDPDGTVVSDIALTSYAVADNHTVGNDFVGASLDQVGIASNGDEFAVVYDDWDRATAQRSVRFVRISAAGVAGATVVVASDAELPSAAGPAIAWSPTYGGYIISGTISRKVYYRRIGAQGTTLAPPVFFAADYCNTSLGIAPNGRAAIGCVYMSNNMVGYVEPDGSVVEPARWLGERARQHRKPLGWYDPRHLGGQKLDGLHEPLRYDGFTVRGDSAAERRHSRSVGGDLDCQFPRGNHCQRLERNQAGARARHHRRGQPPGPACQDPRTDRRRLDGEGQA
jgi:hypothetical protein